MDAMAVSEYVELAWDDFAWLDHPAPALSDAVTEGSVASVLTVTHKGPLDSDMVALPMFDPRTSAGDILANAGMAAGMSTSKKLVPRKAKGASAVWLDDY